MSMVFVHFGKVHYEGHFGKVHYGGRIGKVHYEGHFSKVHYEGHFGKVHYGARIGGTYDSYIGNKSWFSKLIFLNHSGGGPRVN